MKVQEILKEDCIAIKSALIITDCKKEKKSLLEKGLANLKYSTLSFWTASTLLMLYVIVETKKDTNIQDLKFLNQRIAVVNTAVKHTE